MISSWPSYDSRRRMVGGNRCLSGKSDGRRIKLSSSSSSGSTVVNSFNFIRGDGGTCELSLNSDLRRIIFGGLAATSC